MDQQQHDFIDDIFYNNKDTVFEYNNDICRRQGLGTPTTSLSSPTASSRSPNSILKNSSSSSSNNSSGRCRTNSQTSITGSWYNTNNTIGASSDDPGIASDVESIRSNITDTSPRKPQRKKTNDDMEELLMSLSSMTYNHYVDNDTKDDTSRSSGTIQFIVHDDKENSYIPKNCNNESKQQQQRRRGGKKKKQEKKQVIVIDPKEQPKKQTIDSRRPSFSVNQQQLQQQCLQLRRINTIYRINPYCGPNAPYEQSASLYQEQSPTKSNLRRIGTIGRYPDESTTTNTKSHNSKQQATNTNNTNTTTKNTTNNNRNRQTQRQRKQSMSDDIEIAYCSTTQQQYHYHHKRYTRTPTSKPKQQHEQSIGGVPIIVYRVTCICFFLTSIMRIIQMSYGVSMRHEIIIQQQQNDSNSRNEPNNNKHESDREFWIPDYVKVHTYHYDPNTDTSSRSEQTIVQGNNNNIMLHNNNISACIVTAYFRLERSKHSTKQYIEQWIPNFVSLQDDCLVIFCDGNLIETIYSYRIQKLQSNRHIITKTIKTTLFVEMQIQDLPISYYYYDPINNQDSTTTTTTTTTTENSLMYPLDQMMIPPPPPKPNNNQSDIEERRSRATQFWESQLVMDIEKKIHGHYTSFWIWLSKSWFVVVAGNIISKYNSNNGRSTTSSSDSRSNDDVILLWSDIGLYRHKNSQYNNQQILHHTDIVPTDSILWIAHRPPNPHPYDVYWDNKLNATEKQYFYHSGSIAVGYHSKWQQYHNYFLSTIQQYVQRNKFIGEDQTILQTTCLLHPTICSYVNARDIPDNRYFGLRHVLLYGNTTKGRYNTDNGLLPSFWSPPAIQLSEQQ